jgi:hypothetical protein
LLTPNRDPKGEAGASRLSEELMMWEKIRILFISANPWKTARILVDEEAREMFEKLQEGPYRNRFDLQKHTATRAIDLQRLLLFYRPHIVHFSGHGSENQRLILGGMRGRGREIEHKALAAIFSLYRSHVRLVVLNACLTAPQAESIARVIDFAIGTRSGIGDKAGVAFAGAFYRALGFGMSVRQSFQSAKAEMDLIKMPRAGRFELFVRENAEELDPFRQGAYEAELAQNRFALNQQSDCGNYYSAWPASMAAADPSLLATAEIQRKRAPSRTAQRAHAGRRGPSRASATRKERAQSAKDFSLLAPRETALSETNEPKTKSVSTLSLVKNDLLSQLARFSLNLRAEITIEVESETVTSEEPARVTGKGRKPRTAAKLVKKTCSKYRIHFRSRSKPD